MTLTWRHVVAQVVAPRHEGGTVARLRRQVHTLEAEAAQLRWENNRLRDEQQHWWRRAHEPETQP